MSGKEEKWRPVANPDRVKAMLELRRSSAAEPQKLPWQKGSRQEKKRKAIREQSDE